MSLGQFSAAAIRLAAWMAIASPAIVTLPGWAQAGCADQCEKVTETGSPRASINDESILLSEIHNIDQLGRPATTVKDWMAQVEAATTQVTGVKLNRTDTELEIVLETQDAKPLQVDATKFRTEGNSLIADIPSAVLALPEGQAFVAENPTPDIATVQVVQQQASSIRISVTGNNALPKTEVTLKAGAFAYSLNPEPEEPEEEIVVTGQAEGSYFVPDTSLATKTDTPIRDLPVSIQIVPQQVLEDRRIRSIAEGIETVSGVVEAGKYFNGTNDFLSIRGFTVSRTLRNGFPENAGNSPISTIPAIVLDRIEVLKGPSSVITGAIEPGGIVNYVTKRPLREPSYKIGFEAGSFGRYQPSIDLSGSLTADRNVLYRLIAAYEHRENIQEFGNSEITSLAPSISVKLGDRTDLDLYFEYSRYYANPFISGVPVLDDGSLPERSLYPGYPGFNEIDASDRRAGYSLTHSFNENLQIRNNFAFTNTFYKRRQVYVDSIVEDRFLRFGTFDADESYYNYYAGIDFLSKFRTGFVAHNVLVGFDFNYYTTNAVSANNFDPTVVPFLDIRNPNYNALTAKPEVFASPTTVTDRKSYGLYIQDQITFSKQWKLLIGGRYDWISDDTGSISLDGVRTTSVQNDGAFSPRIGLVYQPSQNVSLYASYTQSFNPAIGRNPDDKPFEPTKGTQYEVGVKTDLLNGKLSATLAAYNITKTNVLTPDPDPSLAVQGFQVQVGEQRSRGIELDVAGEILPGWKIIASYAYTGATVTTDNSDPSTVGNRLANVPQNQASLWTTYEIQKGDVKGLGFGFGLFYVGDRQGDLENTFSLGSYLRTDAAVYYRRNQFNAAINIRNLFNVNYISSSSYRLYVDRGEPFTVVGSVSWEF
ncbi:MAG: TonB-dependent siderophore receptor [Aphanocapsa sp. GSE-SYN-MK-11-07L]|nr:TonB-dependent siderophore receptor [Aphanocapsa sp. GSE-SYN-MK-11-07L]